MLTSFGFIFAALVEYIIVLNTPNKMVDCCTFFKKKEKDDIAQARVSNVLSLMKSLKFEIHVKWVKSVLNSGDTTQFFLDDNTTYSRCCQFKVD